MIRTTISLLFVASILAACSGNSNNSDGGSDATADGPNDSACAAWAAARCQKADSCSQSVANKLAYGDEPTCESRQRLSCEAALAAKDNSSTASFFSACAAAIGSEACTDFENENIPPSCVPAPGTRADGTACSFNGQCTSTWCHVPEGAACGTCAELPVAGASCATNTDCGGRGLVCAQNACAARVALGGACDLAAPCAVGLSCVGATATVKGQCETDGTTVGATCDAKRKTAAGCYGVYGLYCTVAGQCASVGFASAGQSCGLINTSDAGGGLDAGAPYDVTDCTGGAACDAQKCVAPAADGAACDTANGPPCLAPARCVLGSDAGTAGTCAPPGASACQ